MALAATVSELTLPKGLQTGRAKQLPSREPQGSGEARGPAPPPATAPCSRTGHSGCSPAMTVLTHS